MEHNCSKYCKSNKCKHNHKKSHNDYHKDHHKDQHKCHHECDNRKCCHKKIICCKLFEKFEIFKREKAL